MAERIMILMAVFFACGYGTKQLLGGFKEKYFEVALLGLAALLLARIYYLIIILSAGNDEVLTVGVLGQASAYLFFMTANISFLPREIPAKDKKKICVPGAVGAIILGIMFLLSAVFIGTAGAYIGEIIYIFSMCSAFYTAARTISYRGEHTAGDAACSFNSCVCLLAALNACSELAAASVPEPVLPTVIRMLAAASSVVIVIMMPLLRRGMNRCLQ